ncbi:MAG: hypothetical protein AMJ54_11785 [Deltaproteobacteria bacterium SG8_13]|nr:MAG: hypothetical protein AMJ54_11785 [Deltaproteobacteria bacterium SG8_13]
MKQYVVDELRPADHDKIRKCLEDRYGKSVFDGLYWVPLEERLYARVQSDHKQCQPFYFALNLKPNLLAGELLVRTQNRVRCDCIGYATDRQRDWLIALVDGMFAELDIKT